MFLSEVARDMSEENWDGSDVTFPIIMSPLQGGGAMTETSTMNYPHQIDTERATLGSAIQGVPDQLHEEARRGLEEPERHLLGEGRAAEDADGRGELQEDGERAGLGNSDALIAPITASTATTAVTVATTANWHQLYPGRIVTILTRSNGAAITNGVRRQILSVNRTTGVISLNTLSGNELDTGNVTVTSAEGIYLENSYGNALQGYVTAAATTGIFQNINKANVAGWQGTHATPTSASDLTQTTLNKLERELMNFSGVDPELLPRRPRASSTCTPTT